MKEQEFLDKIELIQLDCFGTNFSIDIPIYYNLDDDGNVILDEESMDEEFKHKIEMVKELLE